MTIEGLSKFPQTLRAFPYRKNPSEVFFRFRPMDFFSIVEALKRASFKIFRTPQISFERSHSLESNIVLRKYQQTALKAWEKSLRKGLLVLPTGAGKTIIGMAAIEAASVNSLIIVPTLNLVNQWINNLRETFNESIGQYGGGEQDLKPITVATYESAAIYLRQLRQHFGLLVVDEAHHIAAPSYLRIAEGLIAPYRLGLTATLAEEDPEYKPCVSVLGKVLIRISPDELQKDDHIAHFKLQKIWVDLDLETKTDYDHFMTIYQQYMRKRNLYSLSGFQKMILMSGRDHAAREALLAYRKARELSFNAEEKINVIKTLLQQHSDESILIFTESVALAERLSREFLIPCVSSQTPREERNFVMNKFRNRELTCLAAARVLDEGVDVPDASVGIIVSGSGKTRQMVQRLGRLLRPAPKKEKAILYEVLSRGTKETATSRRRQPQK